MPRLDANGLPDLDEVLAGLTAAEEQPVGVPATPLDRAPAPAPRDRLRDPAFQDFVARQAHARAQIAAAQGKADEARRLVDVGNSFRRAADRFAGRQTDEGALAARLADADRPVQQALQQQAVGRDAMKDASAELGVNKELLGQREHVGELDPNSEVSKRARLLAVNQRLIPANYPGEFTAAMYADMLKGASIEEAKAHHSSVEQTTKFQREEGAQHHRELEQQQRDHLKLEYAKLAEMARQHDLQFSAKTAKEKEIPPRQAERYAGILSTANSIAPYAEQLDAATGSALLGNGPVGGRMAGANPWKSENTAKALATEHMMKVKLARALHGGVPSKLEIEQAGVYIPSIRDNPDQRKAKIEAIGTLLKEEIVTLKQTYSETGLNTSRLSSNADAHAAPAAPAKGTAKVRYKGQTLEIPVSDLAAAKTDGAEVVQ